MTARSGERCRNHGDRVFQDSTLIREHHHCCIFVLPIPPPILQATDATFSRRASPLLQLALFWLLCSHRAGSPPASTAAHGSDESTRRVCSRNAFLRKYDHNDRPQLYTRGSLNSDEITRSIPTHSFTHACRGPRRAIRLPSISTRIVLRCHRSSTGQPLVLGICRLRATFEGVIDDTPGTRKGWQLCFLHKGYNGYVRVNVHSHFRDTRKGEQAVPPKHVHASATGDMPSVF